MKYSCKKHGPPGDRESVLRGTILLQRRLQQRVLQTGLAYSKYSQAKMKRKYQNMNLNTQISKILIQWGGGG